MKILSKRVKRIMAAADIADYIIKNTTPFQQDIHTRTKDEDPDEPIPSAFKNDFEKITQTISIYRELKSTGEGDSITFTVDKSFNWLEYVIFEQELPPLQVKKKYANRVQICWPHNICINSFKSISSIVMSEQPEPAFTRQALDALFEWYIEPGQREQHDANMGNIPSLELWTNRLHHYKTRVKLPWSFSRHRSEAQALLLFPPNETSEFRVDRNRLIGELLRMRMRRITDQDGKRVTTEFLEKERVDTENLPIWSELTEQEKLEHKYGLSEWEQIKCNLRCIDGLGKLETLSKPLMYGRYSQSTPPEILHWKNCGLDRKIHMFNIVTIRSENTVKYGEVSNVKITGTAPVMAVIWTAENQKAVSYNNYSNYTTDADDLYRGFDPISHLSVTLKNGQKMYDKFPCDFFSRNTSEHFKSSPVVRGHFGLSFAEDAFCIDADSGIVPSKLDPVFTFDMKNMDPRLVPVNGTDNHEFDIDGIDSLYDPSDNDSNFYLYLHCITYSTSTYVWNRDSKTYSLKIDRGENN